MYDWFYNRAIHDVEKTDFYVKDIPFPAITICSNNKIVKRQLESVLLTQPWKGYNKIIDNFDKDFESALTSLVLAQEYPQSLSHLSQGAIDILNEHKDILPDVMKKVKWDGYFFRYHINQINDEKDTMFLLNNICMEKGYYFSRAFSEN